MNATIPTIIVTSPGFQVSLCPRATIQVRMNGAAHAATSSQSSVVKTVHALADCSAAAQCRRPPERAASSGCRSWS